MFDCLQKMSPTKQENLTDENGNTLFLHVIKTNNEIAVKLITFFNVNRRNQKNESLLVMVLNKKNLPCEIAS